MHDWKSLYMRALESLNAERNTNTILSNAVIKRDQVIAEQRERIAGLSNEARKLMMVIHKKNSGGRKERAA